MILEVLCRTTGMRFAAVARVTQDRWVACSVRDDIQLGLSPGGELDVESTLCHEVRQSREVIAIDHVAEDGQYCGHRTPAQYGFQSYVSTPIILGDGSFFGTLCALDPKPAKVRTPETLEAFKLFAELIAFHLDAMTRLESSEASLQTERATAELREQFIAVLGHDLRNPLNAIVGSATLLPKLAVLDDAASATVTRITRSARRMAGLIDDVQDFARGRLGGGLTLKRNADEPIEAILEHVIAELRTSFPDRTIDAQLSLDQAVVCDRSRVGQLLSNLLANALTHGSLDAPVQVAASTRDGWFELTVTNAGEPIAPAALESLFHPFVRGAVRPGQQGLGLGLYIASEIARAHGGTLDVSSTPAATRFSFRMPLA